MHRDIPTYRLIIGSLTGGISSLVILLPQLPFVASSGLKIIFGVIIVLVAFGYEKILLFVKYLIVFMIINFIFAGLMLALWLFCCPFNMFMNNGSVYFDISFIAITLSTAVAYFVIKLIRRFIDKGTILNSKYSLTITNNGNTVTAEAMADTGNNAVDFFSGKPIIICDKETFTKISPEIDFATMKGIHIVPYNTISGNGILYAFKPENVTVKTEKDEKNVNVFIALSDELNKDKYKAVFNPKLLI